MKVRPTLLLFCFAIAFLSCEKEEEKSKSTTSNSSISKTIEVGDYLLDFPSAFELAEGQGIDSYVGEISGFGIVLKFDFGVYTSPFENLSKDKFNVVEETFDTVERQIIIANSPIQDMTALHIRDLENYSQLGNYVSLHITTNNISREQQEIVIAAFETARLAN